MELIVFDLDGTLLNEASAITEYTSETLKLLAEHEIAYTVATGRTLHGAKAILEGHQFQLPQAYKNGVMIWHPEQRQFSSGAMLTTDELDHIVHACIGQGVTPFVFTLEEDQENRVYHPALQSAIEERLIHNLGIEDNISPRPLDELPADAAITHVNAIGPSEAINAVSSPQTNAPAPARTSASNEKPLPSTLSPRIPRAWQCSIASVMRRTANGYSWRM